VWQELGTDILLRLKRSEDASPPIMKTILKLNTSFSESPLLYSEVMRSLS
jgi:hypothetical protein